MGNTHNKILIRNRFTGEVIHEEVDVYGTNNLFAANLEGVSLKQADLRGQNLENAKLWGADLTEADLTGANLTGTSLSEASLMGAILTEEVPFVENLDAKILERIEKGTGLLNMKRYHTCRTTHCRAGWAVVLGGRKGKALEKKLGPNAAGALIYALAYPDLPVPNFYATNKEAIKDIKFRAERKSRT